MFTWGSIILALLKIVEWIMSNVEHDKWVKAGHDEAISEQTKAILGRVELAKAVSDKVKAMSDSQVDSALRDLEPK
jgi:hypothetical protein